MKPLLLSTALALTMLGSAALADTCPPAPDHSAEFTELFARMQDATSQGDAQLINSQMWALWVDAPNEQAQALLDRGMIKTRSSDFLGALGDFDRLVEYCPDYAEGYNQRAYVHFLRHDFANALAELDKALERSPNHVGVLSGRALTLLGLGRIDEARSALNAALELNPWLSERSLAAPGGPLAPKGQDI